MEDHLSSSQNSDLNSKQLDEIEQKAQAKNTKRAIEWAVKKFEKWCKMISFIDFMFSYVLYIRGGVDRHARLFKFVICVHLLFSINIVLPIDLLASRSGVVRCVENGGFHIRKTI